MSEFKLTTVEEFEAATARLLETGAKVGADSWQMRVKNQTPHCKFGEQGVCCRICSMGPCRITPKAPRGICGCDVHGIVGRNFLRFTAGGAATHSDHGREICITLGHAKEGGDYQVKDPEKLIRIAKEWGVETEGKDIYDLAHEMSDLAQEEYGKFDPLEVEGELIREWIVSLMDRGYTSTSVNRKLSSLRSFYKYLLRQGEVTVDPLRKITGPKNKKPLPAFLKESEMDKLLDDTDFGEGFKGCRDRLIIGVFYATGIRLSELIGLDDKDVDFSASLLKVTGKRNKQRLIPFGDELKELMLEYINVRNETIPERSEAFFVKEDGERLYKNLVYNLVKRNLSKVATLKKRSPHVLRHTFATTMLNNDAELGAVKELLGHESVATTEIYTHATFEELKKVYKQAHPRA